MSEQRHLDVIPIKPPLPSPLPPPPPRSLSLPSKALLPPRKPRSSQPAAGLLLPDKPGLPVADEQRLSAQHCSGEDGLAPIGSCSLSTLLLPHGAPLCQKGVTAVSVFSVPGNQTWTPLPLPTLTPLGVFRVRISTDISSQRSRKGLKGRISLGTAVEIVAP